MMLIIMLLDGSKRIHDNFVSVIEMVKDIKVSLAQSCISVYAYD
ncbi:hypothetical protein [Buchnera aphidicola]|nr:hypothetical protein [Buchnera aphidicola]